ncbi:MAG: hypothetical protein ACRDD1_17825, partial [Planctomycetia bacterium]
DYRRNLTSAEPEVKKHHGATKIGRSDPQIEIGELVASTIAMQKLQTAEKRIDQSAPSSSKSSWRSVARGRVDSAHGFHLSRPDAPPSSTSVPRHGTVPSNAVSPPQSSKRSTSGSGPRRLPA